MILGNDLVDDFMDRGPWAVFGASPNRDKFGNKVLRAYQHTKREVYPIHPVQDEIEGLPVYRSLADLPATVRGVSVITPPAVSETIVEDIAAHGAEYVWFQPGAESDEAIAKAERLGLKVIAGGPCLLVVTGFFG
jgi:predicted CoA-binding protein